MNITCGGSLHYKPRNTNVWQYPLVVSSISYALRERKGKRWLERDCVLTVTNTKVERRELGTAGWERRRTSR